MINSCTGAIEYGDIIYYSHLVPIAISVVFIFFVLKNTKLSFLSSLFSIFTLTFCIWLTFDLVAWISTEQSLIEIVWRPLDFLNIVFYVLGLYFFIVFINKRDISLLTKVFLCLLILPALLITISGNSITGFDEINCEAIDNVFLTNYKFVVEMFIVLSILITTIYTFVKGGYRKNKIQILTVSSSLIIFFLIFSITEFISSNTGIYEINLYSLFILPIFLFTIIFATIDLEIFNVRIVGTQLLGCVMVILSISQLLFYNQQHSQILNSLILIISISFGLLLIKSARSEERAYRKISSLSTALTDLNSNLENKVLEQTREITKSYESEKKARRELEKLSETKDQFLMIAQHNLRIPINNLNQRIESVVHNKNDEINLSIKHLSQIADDFKNMAEMKVGSSILNLSLSKIRPLIENVLKELSIDIEGMMLNIHYPSTMHDNLELKIDSHKIREVLLVILENAVRYNVKNGKIEITTEADKNTFKISIYNTGLGITKEEKENLFSRSFYRSKRTKNINPVGMGIGLSVSKSIIEAHNGNINIDSEGEGKGVTVTILLPIDLYL